MAARSRDPDVYKNAARLRRNAHFPLARLDGNYPQTEDTSYTSQCNRASPRTDDTLKSYQGSSIL